MPARAQTTFTTGESGSGKSLIRCAHFLVDEFLPDEVGVHYSNFPINFPKLAEVMGWSEEQLRERVQLIPADELIKWRDGNSGPWEYWAGVNFKGAHIALDEAHRYCGTSHPKRHIDAWMEFCGHVRHQGGTVEFVSQNRAKLSKKVVDECGVWIDVVSPLRRKEPFSGATWYDTLQVASKLLGRQVGLSFELRHSKGSGTKTWNLETMISHWHNAKYFSVYDSYNVVHLEGQGDGQGAEIRRPKEPWERFSLPYLLVWYFARNALPLGLRLVGISLLVWAFAFNGIGSAVSTVLNAGMQSSAKLAKQSGKDYTAQPERTKPVVSGEPEPTLAAPYNKAANSKELAALREEHGVLASEIDVMKTELERRSVLTAVLGENAYFGDGNVYKVGDHINEGIHRGEFIREVNSKAGRVRLSNGLVLRLGVVSRDSLDRLRQYVPSHSPGMPTAPGSVGPGRISPAGIRVSPGSNPSGASQSGIAGGHAPLSGSPTPQPAEQPRRRLRSIDGSVNRPGRSDDLGGLDRNPAGLSAPDDQPTPER